MTAAQIKALEQANNLLAEHFDSHVLCVEVSGDKQDQFYHYYNGGLLKAIGLATVTQTFLQEELTLPVVEDEDIDDVEQEEREDRP